MSPHRASARKLPHAAAPRVLAAHTEPARCGYVAHQQPPQVKLSCACPHPFRLVPVGRGTRWFAERGLLRRVLSADRDFDARWALESDDTEFGAALVHLPAVRDAVAALEEVGGRWITQRRGRLIVVLGPKERSRLRQPDRKADVQARLSRLAALCAELAASRHFPRRPGRARLFVGLVLGTLAVLLAAVACCGLLAPELADGELGTLALRSLLVSLPVGLAALAAATAPFAGRSTSHKEFGLLALVVPLTVFTACLAGALAANRFLDRGPAVPHRVPVLELRERRNKQRLTGYWAVVPDWRGEVGSAEVGLAGAGTVPGEAAVVPTRLVSFDRQLGATLVPGRSRLRLVVSPGWLHAERLLSVEVEDGETR